MPNFNVHIFAADNITNTNGAGGLPIEDGTFLSDLEIGDTITWDGGGEDAVITITDNVNAVFSELEGAAQTLAGDVTFDGVSYTTGQVTSPGYTIVFSGSDGNTYTLTSLNFNLNDDLPVQDSIFWEGNIPPPGTVLTVTGEINPVFAESRDYADFAVCFAADTCILTPRGNQKIQSLKEGDEVQAFDDQVFRVRWIGSRDVNANELKSNPKLLPIQISAGALGGGLPVRDLTVSPEHRLMVSSAIAKRMFGKNEVLVAAKFLTTLPGIYVDTTARSVTYFHILLDSHEILCANGAPAESLYLGSQALKALSKQSLDEIRSLFPDISAPDFQASTEHFIPLGKKQKRLIERHSKNNKPMYC